MRTNVRTYGAFLCLHTGVFCRQGAEAEYGVDVGWVQVCLFGVELVYVIGTLLMFVLLASSLFSFSCC